MRSERPAVVVHWNFWHFTSFLSVAVYSFANKIYCIIVNRDLIRPRKLHSAGTDKCHQSLSLTVSVLGDIQCST